MLPAPVNPKLNKKKMGYIKEPEGVDFFVDPRPLTEADKKIFSEAIAYHKATGKKITLAELKKLRRTSRTTSKSKLK
jgi:hypothetical protein